MCLSSSHFGAALSGTGACVPAIKYQLGWDEEKWDLYTTIVSSCSVAGLGVGSIFGGGFIANGRKRIVTLFNWIGIVGCALSLVPNMYVLCIGRTIYGFASGVMVVAAPKILNETIPSHVLDNGYSCSTNLCLNVFILLSMLLSAGMPNDT